MRTILKLNGMTTSADKHYDTIERMIFEEKLRINELNIHPESDEIIVVLNTKVRLKISISHYKLLKDAPSTKLLNFELIANGTGIHWTDLDEDISLKGILRDELMRIVKAA